MSNHSDPASQAPVPRAPANASNAPREEILQGLQALRQENAELAARFGRERLRGRVQTGIAVAVSAGAFLLSPASRQAVAQNGHSVNEILRRLTQVESNLTTETAERTSADTATREELRDILDEISRIPDPSREIEGVKTEVEGVKTGLEDEKQEREAADNETREKLRDLADEINRIPALSEEVATIKTEVEGVKTGLEDEKQEREAADDKTLDDAKNYTDQKTAEGGGGASDERLAALERVVSELTAETSSLASRAGVLESKTQFMSVSGTTTLFTGTNVQILSGSGATDGTINGLGNLIVGYNENASGYDRSGSHNLVVGTGHGYSSFGGLVAGAENRLAGPYNTVSGGRENLVSTGYGSVSGGSRIAVSRRGGWAAGGEFGFAVFLPEGTFHTGDFHSPY